MVRSILYMRQEDVRSRSTVPPFYVLASLQLDGYGSIETFQNWQANAVLSLDVASYGSSAVLKDGYTRILRLSSLNFWI